ncbi:hypothetical protein D3870_21145 [Noviherbaspirillum cavernae]|uniref:Uncharacterized protein n=1 Tax=Noviherbaspirillum cavernae TaxID=2320862 RepID=A0A418WW24_9BURK|nr:hypothetical protein [Noviherbaspirillum cavernae]RJF96885.1 hypothetical protein D3870_21145 [Noviherbaspirillum cavernae]
MFNNLAGVSEESQNSPADNSGKPRLASISKKAHRYSPHAKSKPKTKEKSAVSTASVQASTDEEDVELLHVAVSSALNVWRKNGLYSFQSLLSTKYEDPLERYALLHNALIEVGREEKRTTEVDFLERSIRSMKADLFMKNGAALRNGLAGKEAMQSLMTTLGANSGIPPASLPELRCVYGAKGIGKFDAPLTPFRMATILHQKFGAANFSGALSELRAKMATDLLPDLRRPQRRHQPPYLWLTLADAAAFNQVQSSFGIACDLRRDLVDKGQVLPRASHVEIAIVILGIAESGKGKASVLVNQIVDTRHMDDLQKAKVAGIVSASVRRLPVTMWPADKMAQRLDLIDELDAMVMDGHRGISPSQVKMESREKEWSEKWARQLSDAQKAAPVSFAAPAA